MDVVFVTGNKGKAHYFSELVGMDIENHAVDTDEIQSLDLEIIVTHKAKQAYAKLKRPVIVEDTSFVINSLGKLPGPFIKWFEESMGFERICRLADVSDDRAAQASSIYAYYDGRTLKLFLGELDGKVSDHPRGKTGFGWNPIFIPHYSHETLAEMNEEDFKHAYLQIKSIFQVRDFLRGLDKK